MCRWHGWRNRKTTKIDLITTTSKLFPKTENCNPRKIRLFWNSFLCRVLHDMAEHFPSDSETALPSPTLLHKRAGVFSRRRWLSSVDTTHCDLILISHSFCTGLVDTSIFCNYAVFAGMQTGKLVLIQDGIFLTPHI